MVDKDLASGALGTVGKYDVAFKAGELIIECDAGAPAGSVGVIVKIEAGVILDAIAAAIPGKVDDAVIALIKSALLA